MNQRKSTAARTAPKSALPLQVVFRNMEPSAAVEARIRERARLLERFASRIMSCRVAVEQSQRRHNQGNRFLVRVDLKVPGSEIVAGTRRGLHHAHEDVYVAIRDAFDAARRQLEDHVRRWRGDVKAHRVPQHGHVVELHPGYGMLETPDGRQVYFHPHSLVGGGFDRIKLGDELRFDEEAGELGPQATTVHRVGKHRLLG